MKNLSITEMMIYTMILLMILIAVPLVYIFEVNEDLQIIDTREERRGTLCSAKERIIHYSDRDCFEVFVTPDDMYPHWTQTACQKELKCPESK